MQNTPFCMQEAPIPVVSLLGRISAPFQELVF